MYTLATDIARYRVPILLTTYLSRRRLSLLRTTFLIGAITTSTLALGGLVGLPESYTNPLIGAAFIFSGLWIEQILIYSYHNSHYFYGLNSILGISEEIISGASYEVAETVNLCPSDITKAFCTSRLGTEILLRAGIDLNAVATYLTSSRPLLASEVIPLPKDKPFSLTSLGLYLLTHDSSFSEFINSTGTTKEIFTGSLKWVVDTYHQGRKQERWWGKDNLSKTEGIGREWSYGTAYILERYSRDIRTNAVYANLTHSDSAFTEEKIAEVEVALARSKASNVLVVGEAGVGKIDLLLEVDRRLRKGKSINAVAHLHMVLLDTTRLFATHSDRQELELTLINLFTEAANAGNVILVIENLSNFLREAEAMGVFIPELLDPFLATPALHVIATETPGAYHTHLEQLGAFTRRFAEVLIDTPDLSSTTRLLEGIALTTEQKFNLLFTYDALLAITTSADRYIVEGVMPDKAIELLIDIATRAAGEKVSVIGADYVHGVITEKTGIPTGPIKEAERDLLLQLEDKLHERVVGQERAVSAIARTMRRARAGIQSADKPIGSFLFLGPTGVGKTETAKALAYVFFGAETALARLDMSEYSAPDSLERILGNNHTSGILPDMLREHPYCVLLLDEFEKGAQSVHDLFLQILDEGKFVDGRGDTVNARNTIIIATSNAGSQLILKTVAQRQTLASLEDEIIKHIIKEGVYRPELLNRFDSTIIFEPLNLEEQGSIAGLMLKGLYDRVRSQGYELTLNRELMDLLVEKGYDPEFGARPMQRVIQDLVEEKIAQKIISGSVEKGQPITLTKEDFTDAELSV